MQPNLLPIAAEQVTSQSKAHQPMRILIFESLFTTLLPETHSLLSTGNLILHPWVSDVILHGSRGLGGYPRPDSDLDLSLLVDRSPDWDIEQGLPEVVNATLDHWRGPVELDLAVIFDIHKCGLACFAYTTWNEQICQSGGIDCFGLYKTQKGFHGLVTNAGIQVTRMYPCIKIWHRP